MHRVSMKDISTEVKIVATDFAANSRFIGARESVSPST
jgi:hypothetical protein